MEPNTIIVNLVGRDLINFFLAFKSLSRWDMNISFFFLTIKREKKHVLKTTKVLVPKLIITKAE
jgi:hypothetical protein